jgi:hypothetical protein
MNMIPMMHCHQRQHCISGARSFIIPRKAHQFLVFDKTSRLIFAHADMNSGVPKVTTVIISVATWD